jgi:CarD family transcriptional regulator, regulator of rRNA transcription
MQFQIGDRVVHPVYGVGTIKTLTKQRFAGEKMRKYYEVATGGPTVWVPINEEGSTVLRGIAPKDSLDECRRVLRDRPVPFAKNRQVRQLEIASRLKGRLLPALCEIVRDLRAQSQQRPLGTTEDGLLRKAFKALCDEWAASDGVTDRTALHEIESLLQAIHHDQTPERSV